MALHIEDQDVEDLVERFMKITGESRMEAVHRALEERRQRLAAGLLTRLPRPRVRLLNQ